MSDDSASGGRRDHDDSRAMDLHLCNTYRHLLISLATIAASGRRALVVYLEDEVPLPSEMRARLVRACPLAEFVYTRDGDQQAAFARLPRFLPAVLRRNLAPGGRFGLMRPGDWQPPILKGRRFATGYLSHSGFFFAKVVAGHCDRVVLRESGLNNYTTLPVPLFKGVLRLLSGLSPRRQIWGEEPWIDAIEVSHPDDLPPSVRSKARALTFAGVMAALPVETAHAIGAAFLGDAPMIAGRTVRTAILLTQPLDEIGICPTDEKIRIYARIAARLGQAGYHVYVKQHPREPVYAIPGAVSLPPSFPVEAWPYFSDQRFSLAVAICSAALTGGASDFADRAVQLLPPERFNTRAFPGWETEIAATLEDELR